MTQKDNKYKSGKTGARIKAKQVKDRINSRQRRIVSAMYQPVCKILILIGVATILLAIVIVWQYRSSTRRTSVTTGTITEVDKVSGVGHDLEGNDAQKCRIGYTVDIDGKSYTDVLGYRGDPTTDKCNLSIGQTIEINYDPSHPANNAYAIDDELSDHDTLDETITSATSIGLVGLVPLIIGMMGLHLAKRYHDDQVEIMIDPEILVEPNQANERHPKRNVKSDKATTAKATTKDRRKDT